MNIETVSTITYADGVALVQGNDEYRIYTLKPGWFVDFHTYIDTFTEQIAAPEWMVVV